MENVPEFVEAYRCPICRHEKIWSFNEANTHVKIPEDYSDWKGFIFFDNMPVEEPRFYHVVDGIKREEDSCQLGIDHSYVHRVFMFGRKVMQDASQGYRMVNGLYLHDQKPQLMSGKTLRDWLKNGSYRVLTAEQFAEANVAFGKSDFFEKGNVLEGIVLTNGIPGVAPYAKK